MSRFSFYTGTKLRADFDLIDLLNFCTTSLVNLQLIQGCHNVG